MANLKLKPSKCHLLCKEVNFLGHVISAGTIATDKEKTEKVASWPRPQNITEVRSFLGFASYYRRFLRNFSGIATPLHALTGKNARFFWTEECEIAFQTLKNNLISSPVMAMLLDEGEYRLDTDASNLSIGAVLSQVQNGEERVIAYGSRTLNSSEKNYCVTRRELLAIVYFTKQFRTYLLGNEFLLRTDHSALRWLKLTPEAIGQQARWLEKLEEYTFRIEHRPGNKHNNADGMSRIPCRQCNKIDDESEEELVSQPELVSARAIHFNDKNEDNEWTEQRFRELYEKDIELQDIYSLIANNGQQVPWETMQGYSQATKNYWQQWSRLKIENGKLYRAWVSLDGIFEYWQFIPPKILRTDLIKEAHSGLTGGHTGVKKTKCQVQRKAYWHKWAADVERYCQSCTECNQYLRGAPKRKGLLQATRVGECFEKLSIDLTGPHPTSKSGNNYILTAIDLFSKYAEAIPIRNKETITVARALFDVIISRYGIPLALLSDRGMEFESGILKELCRLTGIEKLRTVAYKPSTNGAVERFHRTLNSMIGKVISENQRDWDTYLPSVMAAYRASSHEATGFSPNFLLFGRENRAPLDLMYGGPPDHEPATTNYGVYAEEKVNKMEKAYHLVRQHLGNSALRMKKYYDVKVKEQKFLPGTWVWYYYPRRYPRRSPKWQKMFTGPFLITKNLDPVNVVLQLNKHTKPFVTHVDKVKLCLGDTPVSWIRKEILTDSPIPHLNEVDTDRDDSLPSLSNKGRISPISKEINKEEVLPPSNYVSRFRRTIRPPKRYDY